MADSAGVSMPVFSSGKSSDNMFDEITVPTNWPPSSTPKMIEAMVSPSIQPLALTNCEAGKSSVRMPYFAGE